MIDLFIRHGVDPLTADNDGNTLVHEIVINPRHITISYQEDNVPISMKKLRDPSIPTNSRIELADTTPSEPRYLETNRMGQPFHQCVFTAT
jgi:hypothetical protein